MMSNQVKDSAGWGELFGSVRDAIGGVAEIYSEIRDFGKETEIPNGWVDPTYTGGTPVSQIPQAPTTAAVDWMKQYSSEVNKPLMGLAVVAMVLAGIMFVVNLARGK